MNLLHRPAKRHAPSVFAPVAPIATIPTANPAKKRKGLYAHWETVDGKLTCKWLCEPD